MVDATQQDAEEVVAEEEVTEEVVEETQEATEEEVTSAVRGPRQEMMDKIVEERETAYASESGEWSEEVEPEVEEEIKEEGPPPPVQLVDGKWVTTVKINGQDHVVPFDQLKTSAQKDRASQQRFEQAAAKERWLNDKELQLRQYVEHLQKQPPPSKEEDEVKQDDTNYTDKVKEYHQALYEDDAEKAAELLQALTVGRTQQVATPNIEEAVDKALNDAFARRQAEVAKQQQRNYEEEVKQAVAWFESEYPEIASNAELRAIADNQTVTLMKENPSMAPGKIIQAAAEYSREWAKSNLSNGKSNQRADRKKKIVPQPKTARKSAKIGEDEVRDKTPSEVIEDMRVSRGQHRL